MATKIQLSPQEKMDKAIKRAWIAAIVSGCVTLLVVFLSFGGVTIIEGFSAWGLIDVVILLGFAYGIYKRSRICIILLLSYAIFNEIYTVASGIKPSPLRIIFMYYYFRGMLAIFAHHKQLSQDNIVASQDTQRTDPNRLTEQPADPLRTVARALDERYAPPPPPPQRSPVAETPTHQQCYFVYFAEAVKGPFSMEQIKALLSFTTVSLETQCCKEGTQDWFPLNQLL